MLSWLPWMVLQRHKKHIYQFVSTDFWEMRLYLLTCYPICKNKIPNITFGNVSWYNSIIFTISILNTIYPKYLHWGEGNRCACSRKSLENIITHYIHPEECMKESKLRSKSNPLAGHSVFPVSLSIIEIWSVMYWALIKIYFQ